MLRLAFSLDTSDLYLTQEASITPPCKDLKNFSNKFIGATILKN